MERTIKKMKGLLLLLMLLPFSSVAQTVRGDCDYDGSFGISDLTALINYLLTDSWCEQPQDLTRDTVTVNGLSFVMVKVDGGSYSTGEGVTATVEDFWICQTEVTQELWTSVMGSNPSTNRGNGTERWPVETVGWYDCQSFISKLNELTGRTFRMPTSVEWEFAARGGNRSLGFLYAGGNNADLVAHYNNLVYGGMTKPQDVALLKPNELGLYDMSGNVYEWCQDTWGNSSHVMRGGCYYWGADQCEVTWSDHYSTGLRLIGFRLAL